MGQLELHVDYLKKSTNGRSLTEAPWPIRFGVGTFGRLAPSWAAAAAELVFRTPHRKKVPAREHDWMKDATRLDFEVDERRLYGWSVGEGPTILLIRKGLTTSYIAKH